jgi:hypothetical protein
MFSAIKQLFSFLKNNTFMRSLWIYLFWIFIYWATSNMYPQICAHPSIYGFILSPFLVVTPHCQAMRYIIQTGATTISSMWILLGSWAIQKILIN